MADYRAMKTNFDLKPCPFCGGEAFMRHAKKTARYNDSSIVAPYKHPIGVTTMRTNFRNVTVVSQIYEWEVFIAGCMDEECIGYVHKRSHSEQEAVNAWNKRGRSK